MVVLHTSMLLQCIGVICRIVHKTELFIQDETNSTTVPTQFGCNQFECLSQANHIDRVI